MKKKIDKIQISIIWDGCEKPFTMLLNKVDDLKIYLRKVYGYNLTETIEEEFEQKGIVDFDFDGDAVRAQKCTIYICEEK